MYVQCTYITIHCAYEAFTEEFTLDRIAVSVFVVIFWLSPTNTESETNPNYILMMRLAYFTVSCQTCKRTGERGVLSRAISPATAA